MPYATQQQLGNFLDEGAVVPADAARLLQRASELVDDHITAAVYDVDTNGAPTNTLVIAALADATCAQVEFWMTGDEEDDILGPLASVGTGTQQLQMGAGANRPTPMYLAPRAARFLRKAGLLYGGVTSL